MRARDVVRGERKLVQELVKLLEHIVATEALCQGLVDRCIDFRHDTINEGDFSLGAKLHSRVRSLERLALAIGNNIKRLETDIACDVAGNAAVRHVHAQSKGRKAKRS